MRPSERWLKSWHPGRHGWEKKGDNWVRPCVTAPGHNHVVSSKIATRFEVFMQLQDLLDEMDAP